MVPAHHINCHANPTQQPTHLERPQVNVKAPRRFGRIEAEHAFLLVNLVVVPRRAQIPHVSANLCQQLL